MTALVGDVGGTHVRLALADEAGGLRHAARYRADDFASPEDVLLRWLSDHGQQARALDAVIAVAGPVREGEVSMTNRDWVWREADLEVAGFGRARLVNDLVAQAAGLDALSADDLCHLGGPQAAQGPRLALGIGTGFGGALVTAQAIIALEPGHAHAALGADTLRGLVDVLGRASTIEDVFSGDGLGLWHRVRTGRRLGARALIDSALAGEGESTRSLSEWCESLGRTCGDLALVTGARGGVWLCGGVLPRIVRLEAIGAIRRGFEDRQSLGDYVREVPLWLVTADDAALRGAAILSRREGG
ncbi:MAG: glucokinase [Brevundimonas sp.]|jgi:glucokinase|uniref:glucokinase n=1 Tax=Brevundimonas sp. TaxID=1871086 RepID=UPI00391CD957